MEKNSNYLPMCEKVIAISDFRGYRMGPKYKSPRKPYFRGKREKSESPVKRVKFFVLESVLDSQLV